MKNRILNFIGLVISTAVIVSCTDLEETPIDGVVAGGGSGGGSSVNYRAVLNEMNAIVAEWPRHGGLNEMVSDSWAGPTRGADWDDNAALRQLHTHTWAPDHAFIQQSYNVLLTGIFNADLLLADSSQSADHAATKFLKSWFYYHMIDKFGKVPYRSDYSDLTVDAQVYSRQEAFPIGVQLVTEALAELPETAGSQAGVASVNNITKNAARMLLAKYHLNKAVFTSEYGATDFTHEAADMTRVIELVDQMTVSLNTTGSAGEAYWKNFDVDNDESPEIILSLQSILDGGADDVTDTRWYYFHGSHYNMTPGGWNGPVIVSEYYDYFNQNGSTDGQDPRASFTRPDLVENFSTSQGVGVGILRGQQYAPGGTTPLEDRFGNPLNLVPITELVMTSDATIETMGFRARKYVPDARNIDSPANDNVIYRYADALLMRAEAALRGGNGGNAQADLDAIRSRVGLGSITANLDNIYAERARELWLEGFRREDMIRFGTYLSPKLLKPSESDPKYLLFSIPADALINPNMSQNPGY